MTLPPDSREFIALLNAKGVDYVVAGAHAMSFYGVSRTTGDLDLFVRVSEENADRICAALSEFGFNGLGIGRSDFLEPNQIVQLGRPPNRIDILTTLDGVEFGEVWRDRQRVEWEGIPISLISRAHFIANKRATGRPRHLDDVNLLEP